MTYSYFEFNSSDSIPINYMNPLAKDSHSCSVQDAIELSKNYQKSATSNVDDEIIEHWFERKWQVSLDYYLASSEQGYENIDDVNKPTENIDIPLLLETLKGQLTPIEALIYRKTYRKFDDRPLDFEIFSQIMMALEGELFSGIWEYHVVAFNVEHIPSGIYKYHPIEHGLSLVKEGAQRETAVDLLCGMSASLTASFLVMLCVDIQKAIQRYPYNRALREIYVDSGRMVQKVLIKGMEYYVGGLPSPAMRDTAMCTFLGINPSEHIPLYSLTMGIIPGKDFS